MKVLLNGELFSEQSHDLALNTIANFGFRGRHRIFIEPEASSAFETWLSSQSQISQEMWRLVVDEAIRLEASEPPSNSIRVLSATSDDWSGSPPGLSLETSLKLLHLHIRIVLENSINDSHFLEAVATAAQREYLRKGVQEGFVEYFNGGGIEGIENQLESVSFQCPEAKYRTWILTDSDALQPGHPSASAMRVETLRQSLNLPGHQLRRRAIENYLPLDALRRWMILNINQRKRPFDAFVGLTREQRNHFNMKHGFDGDARRAPPGSGSLYGGVSHQSRLALKTGFGRDVADLYSMEGAVLDAQITKESVRVEMFTVISELIGLIR